MSMHMSMQKVITQEINRLSQFSADMLKKTAAREKAASAMPNTAPVTWKSIQYDKTYADKMLETVEVLQDIAESTNPAALLQKEYSYANRQYVRYMEKYHQRCVQPQNKLSSWGYEELGRLSAVADALKERCRLLDRLSGRI